MKTLLIVAAFPSESRDGMFRRILEVDRLLSGKYEIKYIQFPFKQLTLVYRTIVNEESGISRNLICVNPITSIFYANQIFKGVSYLYIHSMFNFIKAIPLLKLSRIPFILDIHGAVSSELLLEGKRFKSLIYRFFERVAFKWADIVVAVTAAMKIHYSSIYDIDVSEKIIILPNQDLKAFMDSDYNRLKIQESHNNKIRIIYAGGTQKWQNINIMQAVANKMCDNYNFEFYLPVDAVQKFKVGNICPDIIVNSLSRTELVERYIEADFGFLIRDGSLVNRVANPTKLSEYLENLVIPVVIDNHIGDMELYEYEFITLKSLLDLNLPDPQEIRKMKLRNLERYANQIKDSHIQLNNYLERIDSLACRVRKS